MIIVSSDQRKDDEEKENNAIDKFWKDSFFTNLVFGAVSFIWAILFVVLNISVGIKGVDFGKRFAVFLAAIVVSSLIMSLFLRIKDSVHEISKLLGGLMILISVFIFGGALAASVDNMLAIQFSANEEIKGTFKPLPEVEEVFAEDVIDTTAVDSASLSYGTVGEIEEAENDYYGFKKMNFPEIIAKECFQTGILENYTDSKKQNIFKFFLSNFLGLKKEQSVVDFRKSIEYALNSDYDDNPYISSLGDRVRRNPERMRKEFDCLSSLIYSFVSKEIYFDSSLNKTVDLLIKSHDDLYATENPDENLNKIYKTMIFGAKKEFPKYYYDEISPYISYTALNLIKKNAGESENDYNFKSSAVWIYSFWARRYREKNIDLVYEILNEIKSNYEDRYE
ncbi:hypothetical protein GKZ90_0019955 [Flavobacterium sp. MC2016-06]|uniref:hypothetical protein n=1 Tax=Flavobacterium sp. MC2016-06 TaxID=2676308 RepID=UPI0018ACAAAF